MKNSLLVSFTRSESQPNALAWLGFSALPQGRISHHLELGGPARVAFEVVLPKGMLSTGSGEGCHLLGLGDCLGTGVWMKWLKWGVLPLGKPYAIEQMGVMEVFAPIKCGRKQLEHS